MVSASERRRSIYSAFVKKSMAATENNTFNRMILNEHIFILSEFLLNTILSILIYD